MSTKKQDIYASRDLNIDGKSVKRGAVIGTIETDLPLDRFLGSLQNGAATLDKPTDDKPADGKPIVDPKKAK